MHCFLFALFGLLFFLFFYFFCLISHVLVPVSGKGIAMVCVSRVSSSTPGGAEEDPQLSQH